VAPGVTMGGTGVQTSVSSGFGCVAGCCAKAETATLPSAAITKNLKTCLRITQRGYLNCHRAGGNRDARSSRHGSFGERIKNYVVGTNLISVTKPEEIAEGRRQTVEALCDILHKTGKTPVELVGRWGTKLTEEQIIQLRDWMKALKVSVN